MTDFQSTAANSVVAGGESSSELFREAIITRDRVCSVVASRHKFHADLSLFISFPDLHVLRSEEQLFFISPVNGTIYKQRKFSDLGLTSSCAGAVPSNLEGPSGTYFIKCPVPGEIKWISNWDVLGLRGDLSKLKKVELPYIGSVHAIAGNYFYSSGQAPEFGVVYNLTFDKEYGVALRASEPRYHTFYVGGPPFKAAFTRPSQGRDSSEAKLMLLWKGGGGSYMIYHLDPEKRPEQAHAVSCKLGFEPIGLFEGEQHIFIGGPRGELLAISQADPLATPTLSTCAYSDKLQPAWQLIGVCDGGPIVLVGDRELHWYRSGSEAPTLLWNSDSKIVHGSFSEKHRSIVLLESGEPPVPPADAQPEVQKRRINKGREVSILRIP